MTDASPYDAFDTEDLGSRQQIEAWIDLATVWASWRRASARDQLAASELSAEVTDIFTVRWSAVTATITPMDRVEYQGREYNLFEATESCRREGMILRGNVRAE